MVLYTSFKLCSVRARFLLAEDPHNFWHPARVFEMMVEVQCRQGETQSCAPNQPNQIHTTPDTELRRSRTKNPRQTSCIWFNRQPILLQSSSIKLSSQSLSPKPSEPNSIKTLILDS